MEVRYITSCEFWESHVKQNPINNYGESQRYHSSFHSLSLVSDIDKDNKLLLLCVHLKMYCFCVLKIFGKCA